MLFDYLVTSKTRRNLLLLLVRDMVEGSVSDLARLCDASYSNVFEELEEMKKEGLVSCKFLGRAKVFKLDVDKERLQLLRNLMNLKESDLEPVEENNKLKNDEDVLKYHLSELGSPVYSTYEGKVFLSPEESLARGVLLSKKDAVLLRTLPIVMWKNRNDLDFDLLLMYARKLKVKKETGFLLNLTGKLTGNAKLKMKSVDFFDNRNTKFESYFLGKRSKSQKKLEELNTPLLAKKWKLNINMDLENFDNFLNKHR